MKTKSIAFSARQKIGVVFIGLVGTGIFPKTLVQRVIAVINCFSCPLRFTFYPQLIVPLLRQKSLCPKPDSNHALRQLNTCRNARSLHFLNG